MQERNYIYNIRRIVTGLTVILLIFFAYLWLNSIYGKDWRKEQEEYIQLMTRISDSLGFKEDIISETGIYEIQLPHFDRVDRCVSCHRGMDNPLMEGKPQPHSSHPGEYLEHHPMDDYGCTICHSGQGRAMDKKNAHGLEEETHWPRPLLHQPYIQATCGKCHLAIFNPVDYFEETTTFLHGQSIFAREGCLGCHKARGVGGIMGPDLTEQGEKTRYEYDFQNIAGEQSVSNWLKQHFKDPEMVSPGSQMLSIDLPESELEALATFVMGLAKPDIPLEYFSIEMLEELKGIREMLEGKEIYSYSCSSCHGKNGKGKNYENYETGVPAIMNQDFLRVASTDFINFTILHGRSNRQMASWAPDISGFTMTELSEVGEKVHTASKSNWELTSVIRNKGKAENGKNIFANNCASCHGQNGKGGVAVALNQESFLKWASDVFILKTLMQGRGNTAMPAWKEFENNAVRDILGYMRSWYTGPVYPQNINLPPGSSEKGEILFHYNCSRCHGVHGEGNSAPSIINANFLNASSDYFLYKTVAEGRTHTAMFGWSKDLNKQERLEILDISSIIAFMKDKAGLPPEYIYAGPNPGNPSTGKDLYQNHCSECHGEEGMGPIAPALNNQEFLSAASNGYMIATITIGREGTEMPSWGYKNDEYPVLSAGKRNDIVAFIRSWQRIHIGF
mgnify:CR=1 FL=1